MEDCPDGRMDREKMKIMFAAIMPKVARKELLDVNFSLNRDDGQ